MSNRRSTVHFVPPPLCCSCGQREGTQDWEISYTATKLTRLYYRYRTGEYRFNFRVCDTCYVQQGRILLKNRILAGILLTVGFVVGTAALPPALRQPVGELVVILTGGLFGAVIGLALAQLLRDRRSELVTVRHGYFYFANPNPEFHRQFAQLNPTLVNLEPPTRLAARLTMVPALVGAVIGLLVGLGLAALLDDSSQLLRITLAWVLGTFGALLGTNIGESREPYNPNFE